MHKRRIAQSRNTFHVKRHPVSVRRTGFLNTSGIPASKVPAGHMYLQKPGASFQRGMIRTNANRTIYLNSERIRVTRLFLIFGTGILCRRS